MSDGMIVNMLSLSVEALDKPCMQPALAPLCADLYLEDLQIPSCFMYDLRNLNLPCVLYCLSVSAFGTWPDLEYVTWM